ncbi:hypothetical protein N7495_008019 [Penicillium taxi]|uniref:uncharacterized protein n=1 Tax=Penicillium taxi TaxID=168475 RepID=UPI002544FA1C|nr:uncharacterized protein N7495_008019 [Penicillium taxi]KAJ5887978.1 hypothetical protein N7495_008019 [Penicillium taxi]
MSSQNVPAIPPRPARSPQPESSLDLPKIPPRPTNRRLDRSPSPMRDSYAPSPFNEWSGPSLNRTTSNDLPPRPPSVTIPSLGEEGIEYADLNTTPAETRNVGPELKIHAPRPSLPISSAKAKVEAVTRTDSRQAAAAGVGRASSQTREDPDRNSRSLYPQTSGSRAESDASSTRRFSAQLGEENGIRVPMYPNAGDVQAPSPSPYLEAGNQRQGRNHHRSRSARDASLPPGSYGLHGHGVPNDKFDKAWYEKHPDEFVKEEGQYGPGVGTPRPDWALSSEDLNKIVRSSASSGSGIGTSPAMIGTPEEEVGFLASDEYMQRIASPPPDSRNNNQPSVESPLRKMSFPASDKENSRSSLRHNRSGSQMDNDVIHVDDLKHPLHHPDGFAPTPSEEKSNILEESYEDDQTPILAADEVRPESAYQHPVISPTRGNFEDGEYHSRTPGSSHSRSNSRSGGQSVPVLNRFDSHDESHTPLEDVVEYEPLFPDEESTKEQSISASERFKKRPDMSKHRFPSEDIWEDAPNSAQLHATVNTPDIPKRDSASVFETPEQEAARIVQAPAIDQHHVASHILAGESNKGFKRPDYLKQRFPSRDIWEDVPDSQQLVTTVGPAADEIKSPEVPSKPTIPFIPPRPQKQTQATSPTEKRAPPLIPGRPKPQIPSRPVKSSPQSSTDNAGSTNKEVSTDDSAAHKTKPIVPARPGGSKIAALKAGFLTDLNSRLQLGPQQQKPKEKEPEEPEEKQPLSDARKGRARGPTRRKPATENANVTLPSIPEVKIAETWDVWQIGYGNLVVGSDKHVKPSVAETSRAPEIAKNIAGEPVDPVPTSAAAPEAVPAATEVDEIPNPASIKAPEPEVTAPTVEIPSTEEEEETEKPSSEALSTEATPTGSSSTKFEDALEDLSAAAHEKKLSEENTESS